MNLDQKNKNWLTPLLRWLSGAATRHDEQSLDRLAKDDPFLADALDGYRSQADGNHAETVTRLKANLRRRSRERRGAGFYLVRVAAIGAVMVAAWFVFRQFNQHETMQAEKVATTQQVAESPDTVKLPPPAVPKSESIAEVPEEDSSQKNFFEKKPAAKIGKTEPPAPGIGNSISAASDVAAVQQPSRILTDTLKVAADAEMALTETDVQFSQPKELAETREAPAEIAQTKRQENAKKRTAEIQKPAEGNALVAPPPPGVQPRTITGNVTDESGEPLIGANVLAKGTAVGTITDVDGNYSINVPAGTPALQFAYVGYATVEISPGVENRLDVQLSESGNALSEVVITGAGAGNGRKAASPQPKGGFKKFEKYLLKNMRRPDAGASTQVSGAVSVQFRILPDGTLTDFQPTGSLEPAFMEEAVRLLREGPEWKGEAGSFTSYTIRF